MADKIDFTLDLCYPEIKASVVEEIPQIDCVLGAVTLVDISGNCTGTIEVDDWVLKGGYYYYTVPFTEHKLLHAILAECLVDDEEGYENAIFSYTRMPNDDIRIRSDIAVKSEYRIIGDK